MNKKFGESPISKMTTNTNPISYEYTLNDIEKYVPVVFQRTFFGVEMTELRKTNPHALVKTWMSLDQIKNILPNIP